MKNKLFSLFLLLFFLQCYPLLSNVYRKNPIQQKIYSFSLKCFPPSLKVLFPQKRNISFPVVNYKSKREIIDRLKLLSKNQIDALKGFPKFKSIIKRYIEMLSLTVKLNDLTLYTKKNSTNYYYMVDFKKFLKMKYGKFVPVFYGYSKVLFLKRDLNSFFKSICDRDEKFYLKLIKEYKKGGNSSTFDDRSAAFGIASILFSKTITDFANIVIYTWWISNGDTTNTPYFNFSNPYLKISDKKGEKNVKN